MSIHLDCHGITSVGKVRPENEDQFLIADLNKSMKVYQTSLGLDHQTRLYGNSQGKLLVVADGMGGHEAGDRASTLAIDGIATYVLNTLSWFFRLDEQSEEDFEDELKRSLVHCQKMLKQETDAIPQRNGMGTTLTLAYIIWPRMYVVHVGDSRCYVCRDSEIEQVTTDHTIAELFNQAIKERESSGKSDKPEEAGETARMEQQAKRYSHALWNVIGGGSDELTPQVLHSTLQVGDAVLLCTDGLTNHLNDQVLAGALSSKKSSEEIATELVKMANDDGGKDNITVVLAKFSDQEMQKSESMEQEIEVSSALEDTAPLDVDVALVDSPLNSPADDSPSTPLVDGD